MPCAKLNPAKHYMWILPIFRHTHRTTNTTAISTLLFPVSNTSQHHVDMATLNRSVMGQLLGELGTPWDHTPQKTCLSLSLSTHRKVRSPKHNKNNIPLHTKSSSTRLYDYLQDPNYVLESKIFLDYFTWVSPSTVSTLISLALPTLSRPCVDFSPSKSSLHFQHFRHISVSPQHKVNHVLR